MAELDPPLLFFGYYPFEQLLIVRTTFHSSLFDPDDPVINDAFIFDDDPTLFGISQPDPERSVFQPHDAGRVLRIAVHAFFNFPDLIDPGHSFGADLDDEPGNGAGRYLPPWTDEERNQYRRTSQHLIVAIADRIACEKGWLLLVTVNDRLGLLPWGMRVKPLLFQEEYLNVCEVLGHELFEGKRELPEDVGEWRYVEDSHDWKEEVEGIS